MNKEAIIIGKNYECRKTDFARPIVGEVIEKDNDGCIVVVDRFCGLDADKINSDGRVNVKYSEICGIVLTDCFFS